MKVFYIRVILAVTLILVCIPLLSRVFFAHAAAPNQPGPKRGISLTRSVSTPTSQAQDMLPTPSWWSGICDNNNYVSAKTNPQHLQAYPLPKGSATPASYRGVLACGPRPYQKTDNGPDVTTSFFQGPPVAYSVLEWECVELSMRYMYLAYGIPPYSANGDQVVDNYKAANPNNPILFKVPNDGSSQTTPQPGDILSYNTGRANGHTSVVIDSSGVDSSGTGSIKVLEQNFSSTGKATLSVNSWIIGSGVTGWLHHSIDVFPQSSPPATQVQVHGTGFAPNEQVAINFDTAFLTTVTADNNGAIAPIITIPSTASIDKHFINFKGLSSAFSPQTVFYALAPPSPQFFASPQSGPPTTKVLVNGIGFGPSETVIIKFDTTQIGTAATNNGLFSTNITIPKPASPGSHVITAVGQTSTITLQLAYLVQTNWPTFGFNPQHTNYNSYENVLNPKNVSGLTLGWTATTAGAIERRSSPVIANGIVYIGDDTDMLYAYDAITGKLLWSYSAGNSSFWPSSTVANGIIYVGEANGNLAALDAKTGISHWTTHMPGGTYSSPTIVNGAIYVGLNYPSGYVAAFNMKTGALLWNQIVGNVIGGSPTVVNGVVYIETTNSGSLDALDASTGTILWTGSISEGSSGSPAIANGIVYVSAYSPHAYLYAFNATGCGNSTCSPLWVVPDGAPSIDQIPSPTVANGVVFIGSASVSDGSAVLYAFNAKTGASLWTWTDPNGGNGFNSTAAVANGVLYDATNDGNIYAFNALTGAQLWTYKLGSTFGTQSSPTVVNGMVYLGAYNNTSPYNGTLFAFHLPA